MQDTLAYVKKLEAVGIPRKQAEAQVEIMSQFIDSNFATKQDLRDLRSDVKEVEASLRAELRTELGGLRIEIKDATILYGKMLVAAVGVVIAAMGLMLKL